jgi:hypothetical protein
MCNCIDVLIAEPSYILGNLLTPILGKKVPSDFRSGMNEANWGILTQ